MRRYLQIGLASVVMATLFLGAAQAGPLTPPAGPVAGTGPTQIFALPFTISTPGSYIVARDLTGVAAQHGITISASGVTLDLGGFTLNGVTGSLNGIHMTNFRENVVIRNGTVSRWGGDGIQSRIDVGRIERINASRNSGWGINNNSGTFSSHIVSCDVFANGSVTSGGGILTSSNSSVANCIVYSNTGIGISIGSTSRVSGCVVSNNTGVGISGALNVTIENTTSTSNRGPGILLGAGAVVRGCVASSNLVPLPIQAPPAPKPGFADHSLNSMNPVVTEERIGNDIPRRANLDAGTEGVLTGSDGFRLGVGSTIVDCSATGNADDGIAVGVGSTVTNCSANNNLGNGIIADDDSTVQNCTSRGNAGDGIVMDFNGHVRNCTVNLNTGDGITALNNVTIFGNTVSTNTGVGIVVNGVGCRVDSNHVSNNIVKGIRINAGFAVIVRNHLQANGLDFFGGASFSTSMVGPTNNLTNPWANFIP